MHNVIGFINLSIYLSHWELHGVDGTGVLISIVTNICVAYIT